MIAPTIEDIRRRIFIALDVSTMSEALSLVHQLRDDVGGFKVGMELCTTFGVPHVVEAVSAAGGAVFLDLKLKDIPNTVARTLRSMAAVCGNTVRMLTLHADGGKAMLQATVEAKHTISWSEQPPLLIGVTVLTSMDESTLHHEIGISGTVQDHVVRLARLAQEAGLDGVVASPHEVAAIKQACGSAFLTITPGVRPVWSSTGDQCRVMTPAEALHIGADYLVIGRPVTAASPDEGGPAQAIQRIVQEIFISCTQKLV